ncbi:MAG: solute carrier family 23 protein [Brooklawnia sp.]
MSTIDDRPKIKDPVDQVPPAPKLAVLGFQHVLAFYAGAVIVPLVIAQGLNLSAQDTIHLINADLFTCGIASIIQSAGLGRKIGVRLPLLQGVTFTAVSPIIAIGLAAGGGTEGLGTVYGSIIVAGLVTFFAAPYFARLLRFFPPVVTGSLLTIMGTTLLGVAAGDVVRWGETDPALLPRSLAYALGTLALIVLVQRFFKGFMATIAVLIGLMVGTGVAWLLGDVDFSNVATSAPIAVTTPFFFGWPAFSLTAIISMLIVMAITAVETTGDVFATGEIVGRRITPDHIAAALRADGLSTALGGVLNSFPYTCFAQNVGLVRLTRVKSRWVVTAAGVFMIILGLLPKAAAVVAAIPSPVLGGASIAMFANVAVVGIQTLSKVDLHDNRNSVIVSTSIGLAMLVTLQPGVVDAVPGWAKMILGSGVTLGALTAIVLNLLFSHIGGRRGPDVALEHGRPISLAQVNEMGRAKFVGTFESLFPLTWPVEQAWERRPFASTAELREAFQKAVLTASPEDQRELVEAYHDITDLLIDPEQADADVKAMQESSTMALDRLNDHDRAQILAVGQAYRERHGMPWVVAIENLANREQMVDNGLRRVAAAPERELLTAITQVGQIADARFDALVADANPIRGAWARKFEQLS